MKIERNTLMRAAAPALVAGLLVPVFATPAGAQEPPGSTAVRFSGSVQLSARWGVPNAVTVRVENGNLIITDSAGVAPGPGCSRPNPNDSTLVNCGPLPVARLNVALRDQGDSIFVDAPVNTSVDAGTGDDTVRTGSGNDSVNVRDGNPRDTVDCGEAPGDFDRAIGDPGDGIVATCEQRATF
ncbi:hypothetical protein [Streptomyces sp. NBC_01373]|uniref:hypothetical protein n=1 Tax=Streptomyces sp. NBC_01373 TaxID=2903843 RepID=UPI00224E4D49|nr:hypothetical protein [Streptomyces sp. NBC_01373]MCX4698217.1 hypothetical protein [Streptomyces sp. NBC_01373]